MSAAYLEMHQKSTTRRGVFKRIANTENCSLLESRRWLCKCIFYSSLNFSVCLKMFMEIWQKSQRELMVQFWHDGAPKDSLTPYR